MPGRADERQDRARALVLGDAALLRGACARPGTRRCAPSRRRARRGRRRAPRARSPGRAAPRSASPHGTASSQSRYVRIIDASPIESPMRSSRASSRSACSRTSSGMLGVRDLLAVLLDHRALVLAELLADRVELLAEEVVALLLLRAGLDVLADALAHLQLGEPLALEPQRELEPLDDVDRFEQLDLLARRRGRASSRLCRRARPARGPRGRTRRRARRRRAARGSPRRRRGTRPRARASSTAGGVSSGRSSTSTRRRPPGRSRQRRGCRGGDRRGRRPRAPPGRRTRSTTSATVPTDAYSASCFGTSTTRSSSPTSTARVMFMPGKTTASSSGMSNKVLNRLTPIQF